MGWWEGIAFEPGTMEMIFDKNLSPLYGWMFPETDARVNIGICMDGEGPDGRKTERNVREVFEHFLDDHYRERLGGTRQIGKFKGHPISYTTWIRDNIGAGILLPRRGGAHHPQRHRRGHLPGDAVGRLRRRRARRRRQRARQPRRKAWSTLHLAVPPALHLRLRHGPRAARRAQDAAVRRHRHGLQHPVGAEGGDLGARLGAGRLAPDRAQADAAAQSARRRRRRASPTSRAVAN